MKKEAQIINLINDFIFALAETNIEVKSVEIVVKFPAWGDQEIKVEIGGR